MEDEELIECSNCHCLCPLGDFRPISIGAIVRHAKRIEQAQHLLVKSGHAQSPDGKLIPLQSLFSDQNVNWVPAPPILQQLKYNVQEISAHKSLQKKDTHICTSCFDIYADEAEMRHRVESENLVAARKRVASAKRQSSQLVSGKANIFIRESDRKNDFAFTTLQSTIRFHERMIEEKRSARQKLIENQAIDIDWEGLTPSMNREIKAIQEERSGTALSPFDGASAFHSGSLVPLSPGRGETSPRRQSPSKQRLGSARAQPLPGVGAPVTDDEVAEISAIAGLSDPEVHSSFDVPLQHRFMHELWTRMCTELDFGAEDKYLFLTDVKGVYKHLSNSTAASPATAQLPAVSINLPPPDPSAEGGQNGFGVSWAADESVRPPVVSAPMSTVKKDDTVPLRHPFFLLFRKNQLRLPTPPVPLVMQKPNVVSTAANVEDALLRVDNVVLTNAKKIRRAAMQSALMSELTAEEQDLLADVVGDATIVVPDDEDDDIFDFGAEEDEEFFEEDLDDDLFDEG